MGIEEMAETKIEIIVSGDNAAEVLAQVVNAVPAEAEIVSQTEVAFDVSERFQAVIAASGDLPAKFSSWLEAISDSGSGGPLVAIALGLVVLLAAYAVEYAASIVVRPYFVDTDRNQPAVMRAAFGWGILQILRLLIFAGLVNAMFAGVFDAGSPVPVLGAVLLAAVLRVRIVMAIVEFLTAPSDPGRRPTGLTDEEAGTIVRRVLPLMIFLGALTAVRTFVDTVISAGESGAMVLILTRALEVLSVFAVFVSIRRPVARILHLGFARSAEKGTVVSYLLDHWYVPYGMLLVLTWLTQTAELLETESGSGHASVTYSFLVFILTPFVLAGLRIWRQTRLDASAEGPSGLVVGIFALLEGATIVVVAVLLLYVWNIDPFTPEPTGVGQLLAKLISAALTVVVGLAVWRTASAFLDSHAPEVEEQDEGTMDGEGGRAGNRFETMFPVLRATTAVLIATLTVMVALAAVGVQIGPLLAGAGIFGLAFGFGAQTLVKDVISGMFYLYEDAFRVGEFIESAEGKGAVEKILLRSVRLRHPRGAIFTVPFGSMGTIKNHSRDWVTMKFSFEVAQTEDLERLRKLVKKVGLQLAEDPDLADQFIEPLKSQGAIEMRGANYAIGVKFTCKPGDQFLIRRKAFTAIQKAIIDNGIKIATPRVVVDTAVDAAGAAAAASAVVGAANPAPPNPATSSG